MKNEQILYVHIEAKVSRLLDYIERVQSSEMRENVQVCAFCPPPLSLAQYECTQDHQARALFDFYAIIHVESIRWKN